MTIISGIFLVISLVLSILDSSVPINPAWFSVIISGIPLIYLSIWRIIHNPGISKISSALLISIAMIAAILIGDSVFCGTINHFGAIDIEATKVGENSSLQKLIHMVKEAENKKASMQRIADKCASWLVPVALLIAVIAYFATNNIVRAVTVLVVFCPCALVLATPTAIMAAIGQAAKHGVIIKSGEALEKMGKADTIAFDKTGTLTLGTLEVSDIISFSEKINENDLLILTASAEARSEHPLGKAIVSYAKEKNIIFEEASDFFMEAGKGIYAQVFQKSLFCGSEKYLSEKKIDIPPQIRNMLETLRAQGKASILIAIDAADIALMSDDISKIPYLKRLSNATVNTIKLSITLSLCINLVAIILSLLGLLTPTTGALVHNAGSCFIVLIAALLYDRKFE